MNKEEVRILVSDAEQAKQCLERLFPVDKFGEDEDCAVIWGVLNEISKVEKFGNQQYNQAIEEKNKFLMEILKQCKTFSGFGITFAVELGEKISKELKKR